MSAYVAATSTTRASVASNARSLCHHDDMRTVRNAVGVLVAASVLGTASLLVNVQSPESLSTTGGDAGLIAQLTGSYLLNGAVWAILLIAAGWVARRWWTAILMAATAGLTALTVHYAFGWAIHFFDDGGVASNFHWFRYGILVAVPLGLVGHLCRRNDLPGLASRMVIPVGLVAEPLVMRRFVDDGAYRVSGAIAGQISGWVEVVLGVVLAAVFIGMRVRRRRGRRASARSFP